MPCVAHAHQDGAHNALHSSAFEPRYMPDFLTLSMHLRALFFNAFLITFYKNYNSQNGGEKEGHGNALGPVIYLRGRTQ